MKSLLGKVRQIFQSIYRALLRVSDWMMQSLRIGLVLGVLLYLGGMGWLILYADKVNLDDHTVLVLDLKGVLVEESPGGLRDQVLGEIPTELYHSASSYRLLNFNSVSCQVYRLVNDPLN